MRKFRKITRRSRMKVTLRSSLRGRTVRKRARKLERQQGASS